MEVVALVRGDRFGWQAGFASRIALEDRSERAVLQDRYNLLTLPKSARFFPSSLAILKQASWPGIWALSTSQWGSPQPSRAEDGR